MRSVIVVAGEGWVPTSSALSAPSEVEIELVSPSALWTGETDESVFQSVVVVDRASIGDATVEIVNKLSAGGSPHIVVLDGENPEPSHIIESSLAGANLYAPRSLMKDILFGVSRGGDIAASSAEQVLRGHARDALQQASRIGHITRSAHLTDQLLMTVARGASPRRAVVQRAIGPLQERLLAGFSAAGIGSLPFSVEVNGPAPSVARIPDPAGYLIRNPAASRELDETFGPSAPADESLPLYW
ncbi:MAG: hypothetical protein WBV36_24665, partial [Terriglobales bacterium]